MLRVTFRESFFSKGDRAERLGVIMAENAPNIGRAVERGARSGVIRSERPEQFRCGEWEWADEATA